MALATHVRGAKYMMTHAEATDAGIEVVFADASRALVPFSDLPQIGGFTSLRDITLSNTNTLVLDRRCCVPVKLRADFFCGYRDRRNHPQLEVDSIGARIRKLREQSGMAQEELATAAGISRITLTRVETGQQAPGLRTLISLAQALHRPSTHLITQSAPRKKRRKSKQN